jgi:hypothetical protein
MSPYSGTALTVKLTVNQTDDRHYRRIQTDVLTSPIKPVKPVEERYTYHGNVKAVYPLYTAFSRIESEYLCACNNGWGSLTRPGTIQCRW